MSVKGRLFQLLPQVKETKLAIAIEKTLKEEIPHEWLYNLSDKEMIEMLKRL